MARLYTGTPPQQRHGNPQAPPRAPATQERRRSGSTVVPSHARQRLSLQHFSTAQHDYAPQTARGASALAGAAYTAKLAPLKSPACPQPDRPSASRLTPLLQKKRARFSASNAVPSRARQRHYRESPCRAWLGTTSAAMPAQPTAPSVAQRNCTRLTRQPRKRNSKRAQMKNLRTQKSPDKGAFLKLAE